MILGLSAATAAVAATGAVSSFAWFATNATVTATGMKVKVQSASTLLIDTASTTNTAGRLANGLSSKAATTSTASETASISPVSTVDGTNWFYAEAEKVSEKDAKKGSYKAVEDGKENKYYLANTFYLQNFDATKSTSDSTEKKLVIDKITLEYTTSDKLGSSFRVLTVVEENKKVFCAPAVSPAPTTGGVKDDTGAIEAITYATSTYSSNVATLTDNNELIADVTYNTVYTAKVYLYFDGEDTNCFTDNIPTTLSDYTVSISFTLQGK